MTRSARVVIGVGNEYRRDDGIGPALVAALRTHDLDGVTLTLSDGEPSRLLDAWSGFLFAVVVDAVICRPSTPGRIHRSAGGVPPSAVRAPSTHGFGVPDAVRLAETLCRAPRTLLVLGVEAADVGFGVGLSPPVAAALPELTRLVLAELRG